MCVRVIVSERALITSNSYIIILIDGWSATKKMKKTEKYSIQKFKIEL